MRRRRRGSRNSSATSVLIGNDSTFAAGGQDRKEADALASAPLLVALRGRCVVVLEGWRVPVEL